MKAENDISKAVTKTEEGSILTLDVSAGSKKEFFPAGYNPWRKAVTISIKAPAVQGKANKAIISAIASELNIPKTSVSIVSGTTSSVKKVRLEGIDQDKLIELLKAKIW